MSGKPLLAKLAVLLLIGINLGAYYAFWPERGGAGKTPAPDANAGHVSLPKDDKPSVPPARKDEPADAAPVDPLLGSAPQEKWADPPKALASEVARGGAEVPPLPHQTEKLTDPATAKTEEKASPPPAPKPAADLSLPPLPKDPAVPSLPSSAGEKKDLEQAAVLQNLRNSVAQAGGVAPPVPPTGFGTPPPAAAPLPPAAAPAPGAPQPLKLDKSPWSLHMEIVGGQTLLRASLHKKIEFRILCDRVEMKAPEGGVQALGRVSVSGGGVTASCQKLTLTLTGETLLLEGQAAATIAAPSGGAAPAWELKGEALSLRLANLPRAAEAPAAAPPVALPGLPNALPEPPPPAGRLSGPK